VLSRCSYYCCCSKPTPAAASDLLPLPLPSRCRLMHQQFSSSSDDDEEASLRDVRMEKEEGCGTGWGRTTRLALIAGMLFLMGVAVGLFFSVRWGSALLPPPPPPAGSLLPLLPRDSTVDHGKDSPPAGNQPSGDASGKDAATKADGPVLSVSVGSSVVGGQAAAASSAAVAAAVQRARSYFRSGTDTWQICPADVLMDTQDALEETQKAIQQERQRLGLHTCPARLFPQGRYLARGAFRLFASGSPEQQALGTWSGYPSDSPCHAMCPLVLPAGSSNPLDHEWRGPNVADLGLEPKTSSRRKHTREYVGAQMNRDTADWIHYWDWNHHSEKGMQTRGTIEVCPCLPPAAFVFSLQAKDHGLMHMVRDCKAPMLLLTGGDDDDQPAHMPDVLAAPSTLHWFAQNRASTRDHPKVSLTPGGINLYQHLWINKYLLLQYLRNLFTEQQPPETAAAAAADAAVPACALLPVAETQQLVVDLEHCVDETMECSIEMQRTRMLIGLDEYVSDDAIRALNLAAQQPGFDPAQVRAFFETYKERYGDVHLQVPTSWPGQQVPDAQRLDWRLRMPERVQELVAAAAGGGQQLNADGQLGCVLPPPPGPPPLLFGKFHGLAIINFDKGTNIGVRGPVVEHYCQESHSSWVTCVPKTMPNSAAVLFGGSNSDFMAVYARLADYLYWFSPFGNGLDCHRTWEAMYLGSVPILQRSAIDTFYEDAQLPVLLVDDILSVTPSLLLAHAPRFARLRRDFSRRKLLRSYWRYQELRKRTEVTHPSFTAEQLADEALPLVDDWNTPRPKCSGTHLK